MGVQLQRLRQAANLSQADLARAAGVPVSSLRNWEQDRCYPRFDTAYLIARALGSPWIPWPRRWNATSTGNSRDHIPSFRRNSSARRCDAARVRSGRANLGAGRFIPTRIRSFSNLLHDMMIQGIPDVMQVYNGIPCRRGLYYRIGSR